MADINYNELTHSIVYTQDGASVCPGPDPMFHWDVRFPERLSRLRLTSDLARVHAGTCLSPAGRRQQRRARADRSGAAGRYRTQPITFDEIAEVDEDGQNQSSAAADETVSSGTSATGISAAEASVSKDGKVSFKHQMTGFSRSMDGLVTGYTQRASAGAILTGSDKENTPCDADSKPTQFVPHGGASGDDTGSTALTQQSGSGEAGAVAGSNDSMTAMLMGFQMPAISDISRHRRKRSNRKLRNRNSVPEEVIPERGDDVNASG